MEKGKEMYSSLHLNITSDIGLEQNPYNLPCLESTKIVSNSKCGPSKPNWELKLCTFPEGIHIRELGEVEMGGNQRGERKGKRKRKRKRKIESKTRSSTNYNPDLPQLAINLACGGGG